VHRAAAVDNGSTEVLQLLLEAGAKADVSSETGTPLCWAAGAGLERAVRLLLAYGAGEVTCMSCMCVWLENLMERMHTVVLSLMTCR
jgi:ankyrin repeat protein